MSGPNHVAGGFILTGIYLSMWDVNIYAQPHFIFFTAFFSLLPDIDHTKSIIGKPFYPIAKYLDKKFGHRTITHSLLCYFMLALVIGMIEATWFSSRIVTTIYLWSYASHLILDMLTVQGVPLLYPFKKNACVIPGNPKYRLRSSEFKTESIAFVLFILLSFSCKDLFANGFWNTYDKVFGTVKSVHAETLKTDKAIMVRYDVASEGTALKGSGYLVASSTESLLLFDKGFLKISAHDHIKNLEPVRTMRKRILKELAFQGISIDSLHQLTTGKAITVLKLQTALPIGYVKDNAPQMGTSVSLENVYNPTFTSTDIDSIDVATEKELNLLQLQLREEAQKQNGYVQQRQKAFESLSAVQQALNSTDMAEREKAIKEYEKVKRIYEDFENPFDNRPALNIRLQYLQSRLHIKKSQAISGYLAFIEIQ